MFIVFLSPLEYTLLGDRAPWGLVHSVSGGDGGHHAPLHPFSTLLPSVLCSRRLNYSMATIRAPSLGLQSAPGQSSGKRVEVLCSPGSWPYPFGPSGPIIPPTLLSLGDGNLPFDFPDPALTFVHISFINLASYYSSNCPSVSCVKPNWSCQLFLAYSRGSKILIECFQLIGR